MKIWNIQQAQKALSTRTADPNTDRPVSSKPAFKPVLEKALSGHQRFERFNIRWVWDAAFSADSAYLVTASSDHTAKLWDLASGEAIRNYAGHQKAVVCLALHDAVV